MTNSKLDSLVLFLDELGIQKNLDAGFCEEYEVRILNIDKEVIINKLMSIPGVEKVNQELLQKRYILDYPDEALRTDNAWVRLRSLGHQKIELTIKKRGKGVDFEKTVSVSDFEETKLRLERFGLIVLLYQENKRMTFRKGNITFDMDTWPMINLFLEIEAPTRQALLEGVQLLGFKESDTTQLAGEQLFRHYGIELNSIKELKFDS